MPLSPSDLEQFRRFDELQRYHRNYSNDLDNRPNFSASAALLGVDLEHQRAFSDVSRSVQRLDVNAPQHAHALSVALYAQRAPERWAELSASEQMDLLSLLAARSDLGQRERYLRAIVQDGMAMAGVFAPQLGSAVLTGLGILMQRMPVASDVIPKEAITVLKPEALTEANVERILSFPLSQEALQELMRRTQRVSSPERQQQAVQHEQRWRQGSSSQAASDPQAVEAFFRRYGVSVQELRAEVRDQIQPVAQNAQLILEQLERARSLQQLQDVFQGVHACFGTLGRIGANARDQRLQKIAAIGQDCLVISMNVCQLAGATGLGALGSGAAVGVPALGIGLACFSLATTLFARRRNNSNALGQALQTISQQIFDVHQEIQRGFEWMDRRLRESFSEVFRGQRLLFDTVLGLQNFVGARFDALSYQIDRNLLILSDQHQHLAENELTRDVAMAESFLAGDYHYLAPEVFQTRLQELTNVCFDGASIAVRKIFLREELFLQSPRTLCATLLCWSRILHCQDSKAM